MQGIDDKSKTWQKIIFMNNKKRGQETVYRRRNNRKRGEDIPMEIDDLAQKLVHSRLLQNEEQVQVFEQSIESIMSMNNSDCIKSLCLGFDDQTENDEVMFGLLHTIESFDQELGLEQSFIKQAEALRYMLPHAKEWAKTFHKRILNQDEARNAYARVISNADNATRELVLSLMNEIKAKNPEKFAEKTEEFLSSIKSL